MPNQPKEWWQEMVEEARLLQLQKTSFPSGDMENWVSQKELIEFLPKLIAEADRHAALRTWEEIKKIIGDTAVVACGDTEVRSGMMAAIEMFKNVLNHKVNSRIQQYGD